MIATRLRNSKARFISLAMATTLAMPFMGGCAHINLTQIAYEMLRQEDCKLNQLDDFCTRTFAGEYLEYERQRRDFLRSQTQQAWRAEQDEAKLLQTNYPN